MNTEAFGVFSQSQDVKAMDRRGFLKQMSAVAACAVGAPAVAGLLGGGKASAQAVYNSKTFEPPIAKTIYGAVRGASQDGAILFKGIPYAGPSTGANRFKPPVKLEPWTGVRDALMFGPQSIQPRDWNLLPETAQVPPSDEHCQYLNVWTPMIRDGRKRPVMFYSHGGGFAVGSGGGEDFQENQYHDGNALARNYDVVVVTHNHRLGLLGYLYLGEILGEEYAASGCAGMLDIVAALEWVRDNIEEFGGDPNSVMIFGESGGGAKTTVLTALPVAQGLFHRASVESGSILDASPRDRATDLARKVLAQLGLKESEAKQLLTIPAERLLEAQEAVAPFAVELSKGRPNLNKALGFAPVVDGHFLPANPYDPGAPLISANIPMIVGTNKDETILFYQHEAAIFRMDDADLQKRVSDMLGDKADKILDVYRKSRPGASPTDLFIAITSAQMMWTNAIKMAERKAELNAAPVYMYQCTYESNLLVSQDPPYRYKTMHSVEIPLKFDHPESPILLGSNPDRFQAARNMSHAWASFARNGNPSFDGPLNWPAYTLDKRETMLLNAECHVVSDPHREERLIWQQLS